MLADISQYENVKTFTTNVSSISAIICKIQSDRITTI